jgi:hypothetical protein
VSTDAQQQRDDYRADWSLNASRERQRGYGCGGEVKCDSNKMGDRNHLIALI